MKGEIGKDELGVLRTSNKVMGDDEKSARRK